ncbi:MAG: DNA internalization-related competence protein ComEC/Rec2 [Ignavibacteriae bacterium]|nr:DNA internalization-related competence protein ComEC/Rec2 [Ignavibacteriota bacterium]
MNRFPVVNSIIIFCFGILAESYFKFITDKTIFVIGTLLIVSTIIFLIKKFPFKIKILNPLIYTIIFLMGALHFGLDKNDTVSYPFNTARLKNAAVFGKVKSVELPQKNKLKFLLSVDSIHTQKGKIKRKFNLLCNLKELSNRKQNAILQKIRIGNSIKISGSIYKPRNRRNPGEFNYEEYLNRNDIAALLSFGRKDSLSLIEEEPNLYNIVADARFEINRIFKELNNEKASGFLKGILLADRGEIDFSTREKFVNAGVVHILAVSGLHVGFIVLIFIVISSRFNLYIRSAITIIGLLAFLIITNSPASVVRASIMGVTLIITFLLNRKFNSYNALAIAALIILIIDPMELFNPGFQLSFSAVLSIVAIYPIFSRGIYKFGIKNQWINKLLLFFSVSLAAQIGTLPFTILYFNKLSIIALFANLIVIPLVAIIVSTGIVTLIFYPISKWIAGVYAYANDVLVSWLHYFVNFAGGTSISHINIFQFSILDALIFYTLIILGFYLYRSLLSPKAKVLFIILLSLNFALLIQLDNSKLLPDNKLSIMAIDIGQGDATLIKFQNNQTALVDAGNATKSFDNGEMVIYPLLQRLEIDSIDYGFITHVDADHYRGFFSLFKKGIIKKLYKPVLDRSLNKDLRLDSLIRAEKIPLKYYHNDIISFGNVRLYVLNDSTSLKTMNLSTNDKSGIFKIEYGETSFLLTGDAGFKIEKYLVNKFNKFLNSDVLKVGHHGSKHSTSKGFLDAVNPKMSFISAGVINRFNHPTPEVISLLESRDIEIHRTDLSGAIIYQSDGEQIEFINWRE